MILGATQMGYLRRFMEAHAFQTLVPDQRIIANGPLEGGAKIRAARAADGSLAVVYLDAGASFTLDKYLDASARSESRGWNPRYGVT